MRDKIAEHHVHEARDRFIKSIDEDDIRRLASSYHNDDPCTFFKPPTRGSYNICFFVKFHSPSAQRTSHDATEQADESGSSWVVRVPLDPYLSIPTCEKLETEVAFANQVVSLPRLIASKTTIPIPKLHTYSLAHEKGVYGIASFMIMEYIEGRTLDNVGFKTITLRRLEFPAIGRLAPCPDKGGIMEVEGLQPLCIMADYGGETGVLTSANDYISMLLRIARNAFEKGRKNVYDEFDGRDSLYHLDQFSQFVKTKWLNPTLDNGPFVLSHGDLEMYNLLVNENLDILAVLDWEWSCVIPLQLFMPPTWITNRPITTLSWGIFYGDYITNLNNFRAVIKDRELRMYGEELLSRDWASVHTDGGILIGSALENWADADYVAGRYLDKFLHLRKDLQGRIKQFMEENPSYECLIARKVADCMEYRAERKRLGAKSGDKEKSRKEAGGGRVQSGAELVVEKAAAATG
ncbi:hypothetical protein DL95DRAFT_422631 [Leptodontidium sp. 2 PMI_412]|nr:hypothetical protein DL95DRAFT_422631 [Leptodontidium sp. 2 PMI_412]